MLNSIAVVGGGTMGTGIAYVSALAGYPVTVVEANSDAEKRMVSTLRRTADNAVLRGRINQQKADELLARISRRASVDELDRGIDLVIETVPERLGLKLDILSKISKRGPNLIATNTSALPIGELSNSVQDAERFLGMHFFNPVWSIKLVELVRGVQTSESTISIATEFANSLGKQTLVVNDVPGFATSRLDLISSLEAIRMVESNVTSAEEIDRAATLAYGHPIGPLRLSDIVGLDVRLDIARGLEAAHGERFSPPELLVEMVQRGDLGQKTGRGFYTWES